MEATCVEDKRAPKEVATDDMDECGSIIDAFGIDDLLDFSNEDIAGPIGEEGMHLSADSSVTAETVSCNFKSKAAIEACTGGITSMLSAADSAKDFFVPCDDMVELEWLSNFVEDSFSSERNASATKPAAFIGYNDMHHHHHQQHHHHRHHHHEQHKQQQQPLKQQHQQQQLLSPVSVLESCVTSEAACHSSKVMVAALAGRPRRKRPRGAVWSKMLESSSCSDGDDESEPATSDSLSDCCALSMASSDVAATSLGMEETESATLAQRLTKQPRRNKREFATSLGQQTLQQSESSQLQSQQQRRCTHCLTQKTPQWRAGPEGPKTLCNACGVRYKSGRLLPEYRPAASPTFVSHKHSNSHRKVLEMRRQREMTKDGDDDDDVDVGVDDDVEIEDDDDDDEIEVVEEVDEDEEEKIKKKQKMMMMMMMEDEEADDVVLLS